MKLREILQNATKEGWATGHFNASELDQMRAIVEACKEVGAPAIIGTSEGEARHFGYAEAVALRDVMRKEYNIPIFLNADHHKTVEAAKAAIDAGYDSVHIDLSALPFEENISGTREIVEYAKATSYKLQATSLSVESELGYLRGESKVQKEKIEVKPEDYTDPEQACEFIEKTGVDRLAIAVGNIHGISLDEPDLDIERIRAIRQAIPQEVALVLHAGSGIPNEQIKAAIKAGISNIHINTELRVAYTDALKKTLAQDLDEVAMYKLDADAIEAMKKLVKEKLHLFGAIL
jgi:fructose-bisphosphate aldolase class II